MNRKNKIYNNKKQAKGKILFFETKTDETAYNPSKPFEINGKKYILIRIENIKKNSSRVYPYVLIKKNWKRIEWKLSNLELEDPAITIINNKLLVSFVRVIDKTNKNKWVIKTEFYYGKNLFSLKKIAEGQIGIKDIRLVQINKNKIGIFTRSRNSKTKKARIYYFEINSLNELGNVNWQKGGMIKLPISKNEWVGVNDAYYLGNNLIGVIGHIAKKDKKFNLHYSVMSFIFNSQDFSVKNFKIIVKRSGFPPAKSKGNKYQDIVFPGGLEFIKNNPRKVILYTGVSDANVGVVKIGNPFI